MLFQVSCLDFLTAEGTFGFLFHPVFNALRVEIMPDVAREGCYLAVSFEWHHADDAFRLGLELLRVEVSFCEPVNNHFANARTFPLIATVLKEHVHQARRTDNQHDDDDAEGHGRSDCYQNEQVVV